MAQDFTFVNGMSKSKELVQKLGVTSIERTIALQNYNGLVKSFGTPSLASKVSRASQQSLDGVSTSTYRGGLRLYPLLSFTTGATTQAYDHYVRSRTNEGRQTLSRHANFVHSPSDQLTSFRREPFDSLPVDLRNDHDLLAYWFDEFFQIMHLSGSPSIERTFFPKRDVFFSAAMTSPAAFETTILLYAMYHRAAVRGYQDPQQVARLSPRLTR